MSVLLQELNIVDHDKIYYAPYRKNFYVEVPEIANMTAEGKTVLLTYTKNCVMLSVYKRQLKQEAPQARLIAVE